MALYALFFGVCIASVFICLGILLERLNSRVRQRLEVQQKKEMVPAREEKPREFLPAAVVEKCEEKLGMGKGSVQGQRTADTQKNLKKSLDLTKVSNRAPF